MTAMPVFIAKVFSVLLTPASAANGPVEAAPRADRWSARQPQAEFGLHTLRQNGLRRNAMTTAPVDEQEERAERAARALVARKR